MSECLALAGWLQVSQLESQVEANFRDQNELLARLEAESTEVRGGRRSCSNGSVAAVRWVALPAVWGGWLTA